MQICEKEAFTDYFSHISIFFVRIITNKVTIICTVYRVVLCPAKPEDSDDEDDEEEKDEREEDNDSPEPVRFSMVA